jgi:hypothetical protein
LGPWLDAWHALFINLIVREPVVDSVWRGVMTYSCLLKKKIVVLTCQILELITRLI